MPTRAAAARVMLATALCASLVVNTVPAHAARGRTVASPDAPAAPASQWAAGPEVVPGEYIVEFVPGERAAEKGRVHSAAGARIVEQGDGRSSRYDLVRVATGEDLDDVRARYAQWPGVVRVQPNFVYRAAAVPTDPRYPEQWSLDNSGQTVGGTTDEAGTVGTVDADIDADEAWDVTTGSDEVVIAVIDGGVWAEHPDLTANIWQNEAERVGVEGVDDDGNGYVDDKRGWDFFGNDNDPSPPADEADHGTAVAGVIAAAGSNGVGVTGIAWNARIMDARILNGRGLGDSFRAVRAIEYAAANGADIINASWGGPLDPKTPLSKADIALRDTIARVGIPFVAAAGNETVDNDAEPKHAFIPASFPAQNIISVAATDNRDDVAAFSSTGAASVDIAAPGVDILTTSFLDNNSADMTSWEATYAAISGTSFAAPHVSGVAALALAENPSLTPHQLKRLLLSRVDLVPGVGGAVASQGRLNAAKVVQTCDAPPVATVQRLGGADRFEAAVKMATENHPGLTDVDAVVVASGDDRAAADPLSAAGLVWALDGAPMLLVTSRGVPAPTRSALSAVGTGGTGTLRVFVVGGTSTIPDSVLAEVRGAAGLRPVTFVRVAGSDRYATAEAVAARMDAESPLGRHPVALVANGEDPRKFFDALALSPIAAKTGAPILLVRRDSVPVATERAIGRIAPERIIVAGGAASVGEAVAGWLGAERWSGADRYDNAAAVALRATREGWLSADEVAVAAKLPDALAGGAAVGDRGGVLLLTGSDSLHESTRQWLYLRSGVVDQVHVLGGTASVTEQTKNAIPQLIR